MCGWVLGLLEASALGGKIPPPCGTLWCGNFRRLSMIAMNEPITFPTVEGLFITANQC